MKNKTINTIIATVATIVIVVLLLGLCMEVFGSGKVKPSNWFENKPVETEDKNNDDNKTDDNSENKDNTQYLGDLLVSEIEKSPLMTLSYASVAEAGEDVIGYELTATVVPEDAICKSVYWMIKWENSSSAWAEGKNVGSYVTITESGNDNEHCTVSALQPFGERIVISAISNYSESIWAECKVDYLKRFDSVTWNISGCSEFVEASYYDDFKIPLNSSFVNINYSPVLSEGTVSGNFEFTGFHFLLNNSTIKDVLMVSFDLDKTTFESIWNFDNTEFFDYSDSTFSFNDFSTFLKVENEEYVDCINRYIYEFADEESMFGTLTFDYKYSYGSQVFTGSFDFPKKIYFDKNSIGIPASDVSLDNSTLVF